MKNIPSATKFRITFGFALLCIAASVAVGQEAEPFSINNSPLPASTGFVNDFAGVIDAGTKQQIEAKLQALKETTNPQVEIAVATVKTTGDRQIFDYSLAVARGWKIGSKEDDNPSALLLIAVDDRKYFTQVSRDLEDELPDGIVGNLQRQYLVPEFRKGNYGKGISDTVDAYIAAIRNKGNTAGQQQPAERGRDSSAVGGLSMGTICCGLLILLMLIMIFSRKGGGPKGGHRSGWGGGGFGGSALPWVIGSILTSGGSGGSSSSWGGGDSGGGGWGGFGGGGDFGGGGAGGDW